MITRKQERIMGYIAIGVVLVMSAGRIALFVLILLALLKYLGS